MTFSLRPESLSPILNKELPKRSHNFYKERNKSESEFVFDLHAKATYSDLPLWFACPGVRDACDDAGAAATLVPLNKLFYS